MAELFALPYDLESGIGFYFSSAEEFQKKFKESFPVEEFMIHLTDGDDVESDLFYAFDVSQANVKDYFDLVESVESDFNGDPDFIRACIQVLRDVGEKVTLESLLEAQDRLVSVHPETFAREEAFAAFAYEMTDLSDVPEHLKNYIDYQAMGRDLAFNYDAVRVDFTFYIFTPL